MKLTGRVFLDVSGYGRLASKEGAKLKLGGVERTGVLSDTGPVGFQEKPVMPGISDIKIPHHAGIDLELFANMTDVSVTFQTDTGKTYILQGAYVKNSLELASGEFALEFEGMRVDTVN